MMIRKMLSVRHKWLGAVAFAIVAVLVGSQSAIASVTTPSAAINFNTPETNASYKKASVKKYTVKKAYTKKKYIKSVTKKKSAKRVSKRKVSKRKVSKRKVSKRRAAKRRVSKRRVSKRRIAKKSYKKKNYRKKVARKSKSRKRTRGARRGRGSLMATLASVKPKGLPLRLAAAVVTVESGWRVNARGSSGERGLMQLMPATARMMGARGNLYNPRTNMRAGTKYLNWCYRRARKNVAATIGCYNRGPGKMWKWSGNPITRRYVGKVRRYMRRG